MAAGLADLLRQIVHVGRDAHTEQDGRIELPGFGIGNALVEECGQVAQVRHEDADRGVMHRDRHFKFPSIPPRQRRASGLNPGLKTGIESCTMTAWAWVEKR